MALTIVETPSLLVMRLIVSSIGTTDRNDVR